MNKKINEKWAWIYMGFLLTILLIGTIITPIANNKLIKEYPEFLKNYNKINCEIVDCEQIISQINIKNIQENPYKYIGYNSFVHGFACGLCGTSFLILCSILIIDLKNKKGKNKTKNKSKKKENKKKGI